MPQRRDSPSYLDANSPPVDGSVAVCCAPGGCLQSSGHCISLDDIGDVAKVICNYEHCTQSGLMHRQCFHVWEAAILNFLRSCGRARSWSERQRHQNLWTKKGYDLAYKACGCLCGRGHLRKDLDWVTPRSGGSDSDSADGRRKKKKQPPMGGASVVSSGPVPASSGAKPIVKNAAAHLMAASGAVIPAAGVIGGGLRNRANSLSSNASGSSSGSSSPPGGHSAPSAPTASSAAANGATLGSHVTNLLLKRRTMRTDLLERERHGSGNCGLFAHRMDFSSFNALPRHKLNSYHIKMEDEGSYGNDDIRCFILSNLATARMAHAHCLVCQNAMTIYDRYPLIDGTFFLSPKQYSKACIPVTVEGRQQYLSSVCMACLEGWTCSLRCRSCRTRWDGSALILGTLYSYDVFAAVPCCPDRLRCNNCSGLVVTPEHRFPFFSQYSREMSCPNCSSSQPHFVKPLPAVFQLFPTPPHSPGC